MPWLHTPCNVICLKWHHSDDVSLFLIPRYVQSLSVEIYMIIYMLCSALYTQTYLNGHGLHWYIWNTVLVITIPKGKDLCMCITNIICYFFFLSSRFYFFRFDSIFPLLSIYILFYRWISVYIYWSWNAFICNLIKYLYHRENPYGWTRKRWIKGDNICFK